MPDGKPATFKLRSGAEFVIEISMATVKRVRQLLGVNVLDILGTSDELGGYITDDVRTVDVLCAICRPQMERLGMSDEDFGRGFDQEALVNATNTLMDEVADFFREPRKGLVKQAIAKARTLSAEMERRQVAAAERALSALDLETLLATHTKQGSASPASAASSRGRSRSASSTRWQKVGSTKTGRTRRS
ncbi:MAG: hypothetical protein EBR82_50195 [Caulobacteraceae bacterium]|nr:hypothetical protein [Caulobacteraceae bacterium]